MLNTDDSLKAHDSTMSGYLNKRPSQMSLKQWQQRWFVIVDGQLKYFKAPDKVELKGMIDLAGAAITAGANNTINIEYSQSKKNNRVLQADSLVSQSQWTTELQRASLVNSASRRTTLAARTPTAHAESSTPQLGQVRLQKLSISVQTAQGRDLFAICASSKDQEFWALTLLQLAISRLSEAEATAFLHEQTETCPYAGILLGLLAVKKGNLIQATSHLEPLADSSSMQSVYACMHLGIILCSQEKITESSNYMELADQYADSSNAEVLRHWAGLLQQQGRLDAALDKVQQVLDIDPFDADAYALLGELAVSSGDLNAAVAHFSAAAKHSPRAAWAHVNLGLILEQQDKLNKAIEQYQIACTLDASLETAHANAAAALQERDGPGDFKASLEHYAQLVSLCPGSIEYRSQLCHALMLCGQLKRAAHHVLSLEGAFPTNPKVKFVRGKLCEQQWLAEVSADIAQHEFPYTIPGAPLEHLKQAEAAYTEAASHPSCPSATLMHLSVTQRKLGKLDTAESTLTLIKKHVAVSDGRQTLKISAMSPRSGGVSAAAQPTPDAVAASGSRQRVSIESVRQQKALISRQRQRHDQSSSERIEVGRGAAAPAEGAVPAADAEKPAALASGGGRRESLMLSPLSIDWRPSSGSAQSRSQDFFNTLRKQKQLEAEAKRQELEMRVQSLPEEDRERIAAEDAAKEVHAKKQERMIRSQLKAYGTVQSSRMLVRGRGRGRGQR